MSCADCGRTEGIPFPAGGDDGAPEFTAYWFLVQEDRPVDAAGIEADGEIAYRFGVCPTPEHPVPEDGQEILCAECFDERFPIDPAGGEARQGSGT